MYLVDEWKKTVSIDIYVEDVVRAETLSLIERVQKIVYDMRHLEARELLGVLPPDLMSMMLFSSRAEQIPSKLTSEDLSGIQERVTELQGIVRESDLPLSVKSELLGALWHVQKVIENFDLYGEEGIKNAVDTLAGMSFRNAPDLETEGQSDIKDRIVELWWNVASKVTDRIVDRSLESTMKAIASLASG